MAGDSNKKTASLPMRVGKRGNRRKSPFEIQIVEHVYDGSPRWREKNVRQTYQVHTRDTTSPVAREPDVRRAIENAWGRDSPGQSDPSVQSLFGADIYDLMTCTNPTCQQRTQIVIRGGSHFHSGEAPCSKCGKPLSMIHCQPVENKWLYVFTGGSIKLSHEIYAKDKYEWLVLHNPDSSRTRLPVFEGAKREKKIAATRARLPVIPGETYRFFVSPVQLGKKALDGLISAARNKTQSNERANKVDGYNEQLETTLLERIFHGPPSSVGGKSASRPEMVAVVDPFAYTLEAKEWDLLPIAEALYRLQLDNNERAKKNIASVLTALIGKSSEDKLDLADEMDKHATKIKASHNAEIWLDKHKQCLEFLAQQLDEATKRLIEWLDCKASWVVELAIQERKDEPKLLALGLAHYCLILKHIMASPIGQGYVVRLLVKDTQRIPYKFVMNPGAPEQAAIKEMRKVVGDLAVQLQALMMPAFIARTNSANAADDFVKGLKKLGVKALVTGKINTPHGFGYKGIMLVKNSLLAIDEARVEKGLTPLIPKRIRPRVAPALKLFSQFESHIEAAFSLYMGMKVYTEKAKKNESSLDRFVRKKGQWEYPFQAAKLVTDVKKFHMALWAKKKFGIDLEKYAAGKADYLIEGSSKTLKARLMDKEAMLLLERNAKFYRHATRVTRFLTGPVAFVFGGMDLVIQTRQTIVNWENGNFGGAAGSALLWSAAAVGVSAAVVESMALIGVMSSATAASILGPLGIIAALITVSAVLVFWLFSKSDLELYALHCFLGDERGKGSSSQGPNWAEGKSYLSWMNLPDAAVKQNQFLINLISSLKVLIRHLPLMGAKYVRYGCFVQTGWLPPGARCEVIVIGTYDDTSKRGGQTNVQVESTAYVDLDTGEFVLKRDPRYPAPRVAIKAYPDDSWGKKTFRYFTVSLDHTGGKLRAPTKIDKYGRQQEMYYCQVKVRIDVDSAKHYMPNGFDGTKYLELKNTKGFAGEVLKKWP